MTQYNKMKILSPQMSKLLCDLEHIIFSLGFNTLLLGFWVTLSNAYRAVPDIQSAQGLEDFEIFLQPQKIQSQDLK